MDQWYVYIDDAIHGYIFEYINVHDYEMKRYTIGMRSADVKYDEKDVLLDLDVIEWFWYEETSKKFLWNSNFSCSRVEYHSSNVWSQV